MRGLFDKLKRALGLLNLPKVSKCYILKQVGIMDLKWGGESFNLDRVITLVWTLYVSSSEEELLSSLQDSRTKQYLKDSVFLKA